MRSLIFSKPSKEPRMPEPSWEDDAVLLDRDDVSDFNEDNVLPRSAEMLANIRKWLQPTNYNDEGSEFKKHLSSHLDGTGTWLLAVPAYEEWHSTKDNGILWIKGIPGSGKSVIAATLADHLKKENVPVLYFFFRQIIDANHVPRAALRDWLDQILEYSPPLQAKLEQYLKESRSLESISTPDLWVLVKTAMLYLPRAYCVVDALDEIDHGQEMIDFLEGLGKLGTWRPAQIKIIITSRPVTSVEIALRHAQTLTLRLEEKMVDLDIATFVKHIINTSSIEEKYHESIRKAVPGRANGLFLYAKLAMDAFQKPGADPQQVLKELPTDLNVMYDDLLREHSRRTGISHDLQLLIMQFATHATRPLRLLELSEMINVTQYIESTRALKKAKELVRTACGPLLEVLPDETISVIHHSLTEFLRGSTRNSTECSYPVLEPGPTHHRLALACLSYLQSGCFNEIPGPAKTALGHSFTYHQRTDYHALPAFTMYAANNWHVHARKSALAGFNQSQINATLDRFVASEDFSKWTQITSTGCDQVTPLFVAVTLGLTQYSEVLLARSETNPNKGDMYEPPLHHAAKNGYDDIASILIKHGADLNEWDGDGYRALHVAAMHNHSKVVDVLLKAGADPFCVSQNTGRSYDWGLEPCGTPILKASAYGHVDTVTVLLPYLETEKAVTDALYAAANARQHGVVALLLRHPLADVNKQQGSQTLLYVACSRRDSRTIKLLLRVGADPNTKFNGYPGYPKAAEGSGYTALHALAGAGCVRSGAYGHYSSSNHPSEETIEAFHLMLQAGANVHQLDPCGQNALFHACDGVAARILLDACVNPHLVNSNGETILHCHNNLDVLRHLLERTELNTSLKLPYRETTPLLKALSDKNVKKALILLEFGADCTGCDRDGNGAFHLAMNVSYRDHNKGLQKPLFSQLREAGAEVNLRNKLGCTPLHTMDFRNFNEELFTLLLEAGLDTEAKNNRGETALFGALRAVPDYQRPKLCDKLVTAGCDINAVDGKGCNLLHALKSTDPTFVRYLVREGVDPKRTDDEGNTLWHFAAESWFNEKLYRELLALDLNPEQSNYSGRTPLHLLSSKRPKAFDSYSYEETTSFDVFLGYISRIDPADNYGVTPLHLASTFSEYLTKRLLAIGAHPYKSTAEKLNVFHLAARSRQPNILGALFDFCKFTKETSALVTALNAKDKFGRTAIFYACASGRIETVKMLIDAGAIVESDRYEASAWQGCVEFEEENKNWKYDYRADSLDYDWSAPRAGGVTIADKTRPDVREAHYDSTGFKHRIDEITELLTSYTTFTKTFLYDAIQDAVSRELDYTVECLIGVRTRLDIPISEELGAKVFACLQRREEGMKRMRAPSSLLASLRHRKFDMATEQLMQTNLLNFNDRGQTTLHQLVHDGFVSILERVLTPEIAQKLDDMDWCNEQEKALCRGRPGCIQPLLITACQRDIPNIDMVQFLVERMGVNTNVQTRVEGESWPRSEFPVHHRSALHYLVRGVNWWQTAQALPYLVGKGANVNLKDKDGKTPLRSSLDRVKTVLFDTRSIEVLVNAGADVNSVDKFYSKRGTSCLSGASKDLAVAKYLLGHGAVVTHFDIRDIIYKKNCDALELLLSHGGDPNSRDTLGPEWEDDPHSSMAKKKRRVEATYPLHYVATVDMPTDVREKMVDILLQHGADVNARYDDTTVMHCIIKRSSMARFLLVHPNLDIEATNTWGCTMLLAAGQEQDITQYSDNTKEKGPSLVRQLLDRGANIRARDCKGRNVLHHMLSNQRCLDHDSYHTRGPPRNVDVGHIAKLVPDLVHEKDDDGNTPLHYAAESYVRLVADLLDVGADPRIENNKGNTALHLLIRGKWTVDVDGNISGIRRELFDRFLALGVDVNSRNNRAETPIFNFFRNDWQQANLEPDETVSKQRKEVRGSGYRSWEAPLYDLFEKIGVDWIALDVDDQSLLHIVAADIYRIHGMKLVKRFEFLMSKGLDVAAEDKKQRTPLDIAAAFGNKGILDLFKKGVPGGRSTNLEADGFNGE